MNKKTKDISTKEKILKYAIQEFIEFGYYGARMQRIADRAKINKALLFYYFSNKEKIYIQVLTDIFDFIIENLNRVNLEAYSIKDMIRQIIDVYSDFFHKYPNYWNLVAYELSQGGERFLKHEIIKPKLMPFNARTGKIYQFFKNKIKAGEMKNINIYQLIISIIGQILPVYIAKSIFKAVGIFRNAGFNLFIKQRKEFITQLICEGIEIKKEKTR